MRHSLAELLEGFEDSAFRVEARPTYSVPAEAVALSRFKKEEPLPQNLNADWVRTVQEACKRDAKVQRLRVLSDPPTFYERFETEAAYRPGITAGEEIRTIPRRDLEDTEDFWVFDRTWFVTMQYNENGEFLGARVERLRLWRRPLWKRAKYWRRKFDRANPMRCPVGA